MPSSMEKTRQNWPHETQHALVWHDCISCMLASNAASLLSRNRDSRVAPAAMTVDAQNNVVLGPDIDISD